MESFHQRYVWKEKDYIELISPFIDGAQHALSDDGFLVINVKANRSKKTASKASKRSLVVEKLDYYGLLRDAFEVERGVDGIGVGYFEGSAVVVDGGDILSADAFDDAVDFVGLIAAASRGEQ